MKRKVSICIIVCTLIILIPVIHGLRKQPPQNVELEVTEQAAVEEEIVAPVSAESFSYAYVLRERDGWVMVCLPEGDVVCMETGIRVECLPKGLQEQLTEGIGFLTEEELFDFLESYAS